MDNVKISNIYELRRVIVKPLNKNQYELHEDYYYELPSKEGKVPKGYNTDGATIPRIFWSLFPPKSPEYLSAAVIHDYLCSRATHSKYKKTAYAEADQVFNEALKVLEVNPIKRWIFVKAVTWRHIVKGFFFRWKEAP